jgi:hypothetical protein
MSRIVDADRASLDATHQRLIPEFAAMLSGESLSEEPAELEHTAATLLVPLELPGMPPELAEAVFAEIERRGDGGAAGLLSAVAVLAGEPHADRARAAAGRLERNGVVSPVADRLGALSVGETLRIDSAGAELFVARLMRPGTREVQVSMLAVERGETAGELVECTLTPPLSDAEARALIDDAAAADGVLRTQSLQPAELAARAVTAARRAVDVGVALGPDAAIALPIVARALTGDPRGLPHPRTVPPWEDDDEELIVNPAEEEERYEQLVGLLLDEFERCATASESPPRGAVRRDEAFVASALLRWKGCYGDGYLGRWTADELTECLLDYFPHKVSAAEDTLAVVGECAIAFLGFLDDRGSLSGEPLDELERACRELGGRLAAPRLPRDAGRARETDRHARSERRTHRKAQRSARRRNRRGG